MPMFPSSIQRNEVHLWCVTREDIRDSRFVSWNEVHLSDSELARAGRYRRAEDRHRFVVGRGTLRRALGALLNIEPHDVALAQNAFGRPEIAAPAAVYFNISHTDGVVAVVVASGGQIGVDAERIQEGFPYLDVARRHFPPQQRAEIEGLPSSQQLARFFEYWVLFEASVKRRGMGLSLKFDDVFALDADADVGADSLEASAASQWWRYWLIAPSHDHRLAVVTSTGLDRLVVRRLRPHGVFTTDLPILAYGVRREPVRQVGRG